MIDDWQFFKCFLKFLHLQNFRSLKCMNASFCKMRMTKRILKIDGKKLRLNQALENCWITMQCFHEMLQVFNSSPKVKQTVEQR
jgi:hypothetical protein